MGSNPSMQEKDVKAYNKATEKSDVQTYYNLGVSFYMAIEERKIWLKL